MRTLKVILWLFIIVTTLFIVNNIPIVWEAHYRLWTGDLGCINKEEFITMYTEIYQTTLVWFYTGLSFLLSFTCVAYTVYYFSGDV